MASKTFLPPQGNYEDLMVYKLASCVYAITYHFANTYFSRGDRTIDQMIQAARSAKQNIAEGIAAGVTSAETELKLLNVARASMQELKADYEDYLLHHDLEQWDANDERTLKVRSYSYNNMDAADYRDKVRERSPETTANIALTLIHRYDYMMMKLIQFKEERFVENGGIREAMYRARKGNPGKN